MSGWLWVYALTPGADGELTSDALTLMFVARLLYGLTLNSFQIPTSWVGARVEHYDKPQAGAIIGAMLGLGIMLGPTFGILVSGFVDDRLMGYRLVG